MKSTIRQAFYRDWMTVEQFAEATGQKPDTIRHRIHRGSLDCVKVGKPNGAVALIHKSDLEAELSKKKVSGK